MISYPWTVNWKAQGQDIEEFKYFKRWFDELGARPAVQRGMAVGADLPPDPATPQRRGARRDQEAHVQPAGDPGPGAKRLRLPFRDSPRLAPEPDARGTRCR